MSAGTDGDPHTVQEDGGGDFTTLDAALVHVDISANEFIEIQESWTNDDTAACTIADDGLTIRTAGDSSNAGVVLNDGSSSEGHYRLSVSGSHCITVNNTGLLINGAVIKMNGTGGSDECFRVNIGSTSTLDITNCIIWSDKGGTSNDQNGVFCNRICTIGLENCLVYGFSRSGVCSQSTADTVIIYNINSCTIWDNGYDDNDLDNGGCATKHGNSSANTTWNIYNSTVVDNHTSLTNTGGASDSADFNAGTTGTVTWNIDNCLCTDQSLTARDAGAVAPLEDRILREATVSGNEVLLVEIDTSLFNLTLVDDATNNDAQDAHSNTSGVGMTLPTLDIAGTTRDRASGKIDIGAFAFAASAGLDNDRISSMHFQKMWQPTALGE